MPTYNSLVSRSDAGALIPEDVSKEIWKNVPKESAALSLFRQRRLPRAQQRVPVLSTLPLAYFVNGDTGLKQTSEQAWDNIYFNVEEIAVIIPIPESVLDDADYDMWAEIRPNIQEAIGRAFDAAVFFGTNKPASWPDDIVTQAVAAGNVVARGTNNAAAGGLSQDISDVIGKVDVDGYFANAAIANTSLRGRLRGVRDTTGNKLQEIRHQVSDDQVWGLPVTYPLRGLWPSGASVAEMILGDFAAGQVGIRQDITVKILDQAVISDANGVVVLNLAQQDAVAMRCVFRVAWALKNPINHDQPTTANRNPFGVLRSPA